MQVNMFDAKTNLSRLIKALEKRETEEITIARNGSPVARLTLVEPEKNSRRLGVAKGKLELPKDFDWCNEEIIEMFEGEEL